ncbi:MAG: hypothetical protein BWY49_00086 [Candidatus Omnitrophica bacterium ADurb.Bin314]|nr:MAG: hypothetical protein BWY49_00086 [Candidatus Omnitrophica bacterium ADurb.Bin314]
MPVMLYVLPAATLNSGTFHTGFPLTFQFVTVPSAEMSIVPPSTVTISAETGAMVMEKAKIKAVRDEINFRELGM